MIILWHCSATFASWGAKEPNFGISGYLAQNISLVKCSNWDNFYFLCKTLDILFIVVAWVFGFRLCSDFCGSFEGTLRYSVPWYVQTPTLSSATPVRIFDSVGVVAYSCWSYFLGYWTFLVKIILFLPPNRTLFIRLEFRRLILS